MFEMSDATQLPMRAMVRLMRVGVTQGHVQAAVSIAAMASRLLPWLKLAGSGLPSMLSRLVNLVSVTTGQ